VSTKPKKNLVTIGPAYYDIIDLKRGPSKIKDETAAEHIMCLPTMFVWAEGDQTGQLYSVKS